MNVFRIEIKRNTCIDLFCLMIKTKANRLLVENAYKKRYDGFRVSVTEIIEIEEFEIKAWE